MTRNPNTPGRPMATAIASLAAAILFWASVPLLLKWFARSYDAWTVNGLRYTFAALFWLPYVVRHLKDAPPGRSIWRDAWPPAVVHVVGQILFGLSPYYNDATVINFVSRVAFLFTTLAGFLLLREERPLARQPAFWSGFAVVVAGLLGMYFGGRGTTSTSGLGMLILVGTSGCWGLYSVLVRRFMRGYPVGLSFGVMSLYAFPSLLVLMFAVGDWRPVLHAGAVTWVLIWVSAVLGIALGHTLFYRAIHTIGPVASEGSLMLIPFATALLAFPILGERLSRLQWAGGVGLVVGCCLLLGAKMRAGTTGQADQTVAPTTD